MEIDRTEWLKARKKGVGASDISSLAGVNPWKSAFDVYLDKTSEEVNEFSNQFTHWGNILEPIVADEFGRVMKAQIKAPPLPIMSLANHPHIMASLDRLAVMPDGEEVVVEVKTTSARNSIKWGEEMTDQIPVQYLVQVHYQLGISGHKTAYVPVLIDTSDFRIYRVDRDEDVIKQLQDIAHEFWARVTNRNPPSPDTSTRSGRELVKKFKATSGKSVDLPMESITLLHIYLEEKKKEDEAARLKEKAQADLILMMGDAEVGRFPSGGAIERRVIERKESIVKASSYYKTSFKLNEKDEY